MNTTSSKILVQFYAILSVINVLTRIFQISVHHSPMPYKYAFWDYVHVEHLNQNITTLFILKYSLYILYLLINC